MNTKHNLAIIGVGLVGMLTFAGTASATRPAVDLTAAKAKCDAAVAVRTAELTKLTSKAAGAKNLSSGHLGTINDIISSSTSGLTDLQTKIDADTDASTLRADCETIATGFRIFALRTPQVHLAIVGDRQSAVVDKVSDLATKLDAAIQKAAENGKDVTDATAKLADMNAKLADAAGLLPGVVDNELTFTPEQWNANHTILSSSVTTLHTVQTDLANAIADAQAIVADLQA